MGDGPEAISPLSMPVAAELVHERKPLPSCVFSSHHSWMNVPADGSQQACPNGGPQLLSNWLEMELMERLSSLNGKIDSLRDRVDDCHEGIFHAKAAGKRKGSKSRSSTFDTTSSRASHRSSLKHHHEPNAATAHANQGPLEAARWVEDAPTQPEAAKFEVRQTLSHQIIHAVTSGSAKASLHTTLEDPESNKYAKFYSSAMPAFVCFSVVCTLLQTLDSDNRPLGALTSAVIEVTAEVIFVIDLLLRFTVCPRKARFLCVFHNVVDVLVAAPLAIRISLGCVLSEEEMETFPGSSLLYIVPMIRLLKTLRGLKTFNLIVSTVLRVYLETWPTILVLVYVVLTFASIIYYVEPRDNMGSYPVAIWFVIVTMTTVGYGDVSPVTGPGYVVAGAMVCSTMFVMALPLGIIGTAVSEIWSERHTILLRSWARDRLSADGYTAKDIPKFFAAFDSDGSGELEFSEFAAMLEEMKVGMKFDKMRELFNSFDEDHSGAIDADEFVEKIWPPSMFKTVIEEEDKSQVVEDIRMVRQCSKERASAIFKSQDEPLGGRGHEERSHIQQAVLLGASSPSSTSPLNVPGLEQQSTLRDMR